MINIPQFSQIPSIYGMETSSASLLARWWLVCCLSPLGQRRSRWRRRSTGSGTCCGGTTPTSCGWSCLSRSPKSIPTRMTSDPNVAVIMVPRRPTEVILSLTPLSSLGTRKSNPRVFLSLTIYILVFCSLILALTWPAGPAAHWVGLARFQSPQLRSTQLTLSLTASAWWAPESQTRVLLSLTIYIQALPVWFLRQLGTSTGWVAWLKTWRSFLFFFFLSFFFCCPPLKEEMDSRENISQRMMVFLSLDSLS